MKWHSEKGQALVEFALVLPILILLVCGICEFGWLFGNQILANNACREAARYAAVYYKDDGLTAVRTEAQNIAQNYSTAFNATIPTPGMEQIQVDLNGKIPLLTPFFYAILESPDGGGFFDLSASCTMRIE